MRNETRYDVGVVAEDCVHRLTYCLGGCGGKRKNPPAGEADDESMPNIQDLARRLSVDRAVGYGLAMRAWQVPAAVVTTVLLAWNLDDVTRGVYLTLFTVIGLQSLADSGLLNVLMHVVSHEWSHMRLDRRGFLHGPSRIRQRLAAIARFGLIWFSLAAMLLCVGGTAVGIGLFRSQGTLDSVLGPLFVGMLFAASSLALAPLIAILEGCNQMEHVNRYRLMQAVTGSVVVWSCLSSGVGLWTPVFAILTQFVWECCLLLGRYRRLFFQLHRTAAGGFDWKSEIWPLQWRIGVQSAAKYFATFLLLPTLFIYQSPEIAGRMGMTWMVLNNLAMVAYVWIRTRAPEFGKLIAKGKRDESNDAFFKATIGSTLLLVAAIFSFWIVLVLLQTSTFELAKRVSGSFLDPRIVLWFAIAMIPLHLTQCFSIHIRSQKMDPIWRITVVGNLVLAGCVFLAASQLGVGAVGIAMLVIFTIVSSLVFMIWVKYDHLLAASLHSSR